MTTPEPLPGAGDTPAVEHRLHPLSWLFVLIQQLKQFIVPLLALLVFGRSGGQGQWQWWSLIGVGMLAVLSIWQYFTYRYLIQSDSLVVRSGVLHRSLREIPFSRIHNVALHQSLLHRFFDVAEVRLESAGGKKPEAHMRVLSLANAMALEALVRRRGAHATTPGQATSDSDTGTTLLQLPLAEVLRLGLVSNRGLVVVAGGFAALSQFNTRFFTGLFEGWGKALFGWAGQHHFGVAQYVLAAASMVLVFVLLLRVLSVVLALLQYYGFHLDEHGRRLTVERGLLTRLRTSVPRRRIQAWTLHEGLLHRILRRRSLHIDIAISQEQGHQRTLHDLAPIAQPDTCDELVHHLLPCASWPPQDWQPLHPRAWWRLSLPGAVFALLLASALTWRFGGWGLLALLWLPWAIFVARQHARRAGFACATVLVALRAGWWSRHWRFAEIDKLQALQLKQSPLDRWFGMATLSLDTAGAGAMAPALRLRYLPEPVARELYARLGHEVARRPLRW